MMETEFVQNRTSSRAANSTLARIIECVLALVLLVASGLKTQQILAESQVVILGLSHARLLVAGLIQAELILALWLIIGGFARARFVAAIACFSVFALAAGYEAFNAMPSCGCFGNVAISPRVTVAFDLVAVLALWLTRPKRNTLHTSSPSRTTLIASTVLGLAASSFLWTAVAKKQFAEPSSTQTVGSLVVLEPETWLNKPFSLFDEIDGSDPIGKGRWLVVFYHFNCDSCLQAIPNYIALANASTESGTAPRIAFVLMPPMPSPGQDPVAPSSNYLKLSLRPDRDWFATTPVVVAIQDGSVIYAKDGENAIHIPASLQWN